MDETRFLEGPVGEIDQILKEVEQLAMQVVPSCFDIRSVELTPGAPDCTGPMPFTIVVRIARRNDEPEHVGWGYTFATRLREWWGGDNFQLTVREETSEEGTSEDSEATAVT